MKMKTLVKVAFAMAGIALSWTAASAKPVIAASIFWDLDFFDNDGDNVGFGEFSYDPDTTTTFDIFPPLGGSVTVNTALESFEATILGIEQDVSLDKWWTPNDPVATRGITQFRGGAGVSDRWFSGDPFFGNGSFVMEGRSTETTGGGDWSLFFLDNSLDPPFFGATGTWIATVRPAVSPEPIPEPLTILASATAACTIPVLKREHNRKQKKSRSNK